METTWAINTYGDPLGALNRYVEYIWSEAALDGMFLSADTLDEHNGGQRLLVQPEGLRNFNPFRPAMRANAAAYLPGALRESQAAHYGAVLRPCEMRTLRQLEKLDPFPRGRLMTICVDCLGTFPAGELSWRTERKGSADNLADDTLKFARQGGVSVDRYRPACQMCRSPGAEGAEVNIWVIGLPARRYILINSSLEGLAERFRFGDFTIATVDGDLLDMRQRVLERVTRRNEHSRARFTQAMAELLPADIEAIAEHLEKCGVCRECLDACPICSAQRFRRGMDGHYNRHEIAQWLASCAGCGMCEQACVKNLPLSAVFGMVHEGLHAVG